jgi:hypothetical protein
MIRPDLALFDGDGRLTAVAEVKAKVGTTAEWAALFRRNLLAHGGSIDTRYFLVLTPDRLYIWVGPSIEPGKVPPTLALNARPLLEPYFQRAGVSPQGVSSQAFELIVADWLSDLIHSSPQPLEEHEEQRRLTESGLPDAIRGGRIAYEIAA